VILSFIVVIGDTQAAELAGVPIARAQLARSGATEAATSIAAVQVIEHGLRHLSWLAQEDLVVRTTLSTEWKTVLAAYLPEPFQHL
jgi:hypothetical protein